MAKKSEQRLSRYARQRWVANRRPRRIVLDDGNPRDARVIEHRKSARERSKLLKRERRLIKAGI